MVQEEKRVGTFGGSNYITMYVREAVTQTGEVRRTKCGALESLLERGC